VKLLSAEFISDEKIKHKLCLAQGEGQSVLRFSMCVSIFVLLDDMSICEGSSSTAIWGCTPVLPLVA
jgi:hypothetical protein